MIKRLLISLILILLVAVPCFGTTYNYYFDTGEGAGTCLIDDPCATLSAAQTKITAGTASDTTNLYFQGGQTWTCDTEALAGGAACLLVGASDGIVNILSYGSGKAIFDGGVSDFSSGAVGTDNCTGAPCRYSGFFKFASPNGSITNVDIKDVYGDAISLNAADGFTLTNSTIHNIGMAAITVAYTTGGEDNIITYNTIYLCQQLSLYDKVPDYFWSAGISLFAHSSGASSMCKNNIIRYNLVYDIYGEGIAAPNSTIEYNVVGDTSSIAIDTAAHDFDTLTAVVAYNFIIQSDWSTSDYEGMAGSGEHGIRVYDEATGGDNSAADISVYGNTIINRSRGIWFFCAEECNNPFGSVKIYNNLIIDSHAENIAVHNPEEANAAYVYNNASIRYDRAGAHTNNLSHENWAIDNNAFYPVDGSNTIGTGDWYNNYVTGDPLLPGEPSIDWDGQTGAGYYNAIEYTTHLYPISGSLIQAGLILNPADYEQTFLTTGSDFSDVLNWPTGIDEAEQSLTLPDIGPWARGTSDPVPLYPIQGAAGNFKYN